MHGPTRPVRIVCALVVGLSWAASPALAQVADAPSTDAWPSPARPVDAWPYSMHPEDAARAAAPPADTRSPDTRSRDTRSPDAPSADTPPADTPPAEAPPAQSPEPDPTLPPNDPASDAPPVDAPSADAPPADAPPADTPESPDAPADEAQVVEAPSGIPAQLANWVTATNDNGGRPFIIVDKVAADVFIFDAYGLLEGAAPVLVGLAAGDDSADGVGERDLSAITPDQRTTPAGRFVAQFGYAAGGKKVLWVDYADAISLHPVVTTNRKERRLERIRSSDPEDHRISYGCINVPAAFYRDVVLPTLGDGSAVVYVLPESKSVADVFPAFAIAAGISAAPPVATVDDAAPPDQGADPTLPPPGSPEAASEASADPTLPQATSPEAAAEASADPQAPAPASVRSAAGDAPRAAADQGRPASNATLFGPQ
jgi:hypothetical protein